MSDDRAQSIGAFWELYLHESLLRFGYEVSPHPEIAGTTRRPDFLARRHEDWFYLEAVVALPGTEREQAAGKVVEQIYDELNKVRSPNFFLSVDVDVVGEQAPSVKKIRSALEPWLARLDPDRLTEQVAAGNLFINQQRWIWSDGAWTITFTPWPKSKDSRGKPGLRPVGSTSSLGDGSLLVDDRRPIRQVLDKKLARYGSLDAPYVVAVLSRPEFPDPKTIELVLFGEPGSHLSRKMQAAVGLDGLLFTQDAKRVSAVVSVTELATWTIATHGPTLWLNPLARAPLSAGALPWRTMSWNDAEQAPVQSAPGADLRLFFGLPVDWPGPEEAFPRD
jgi:hypothetical protein